MALGFNFNFGFLLRNRQSEEVTCGDLCPTVSKEIRVRVYPRWFHYVALEWTIPAEWGDCIFDVYHSSTESGNYVKINPTPLSGNSLVDYSTQDYSKFRNGFYVVEASLLGPSPARMRSAPATWKNQRSDWVQIRAVEIQRREDILLRKFTGVKSYLFKRRTYGMRCTNCWDARSETVTKDKCTVCFGTSFQGGYFPPIPLFVQYEATPSNVMKTYFGRFEPNQIGAWTISIPEVASDDILIRTGDWNVYKIGAIQTTELQTSTVRQLMSLTQLSKRDVENELVTKKLSEFPTELATQDLKGTLPNV